MATLQIRNAGREQEEGPRRDIISKRAMRRVIAIKDEQYKNMKYEMEQDLNTLFQQMDDHNVDMDKLRKEVKRWKDNTLIAVGSGLGLSIMTFLMGMHG